MIVNLWERKKISYDMKKNGFQNIWIPFLVNILKITQTYISFAKGHSNLHLWEQNNKSGDMVQAEVQYI